MSTSRLQTIRRVAARQFGDLHETEHILHYLVHESRVLALDLVPAFHLAQALPVLQCGEFIQSML